MRSKLLVILLSFFILASPIIKAQETDELTTETQDESAQTVDDSKNLDVVLSYENQDPGSKEFDLVATITSGFDSDRVVVEWVLPSGLRLAEDEVSIYSRPSLVSDHEVTVTKSVVPTSIYSQEVEVVVTMIKADVNYISSDKYLFEFNEAREILPITDEYSDAKTIYTLKKIGLYSVLGIGALVAAIYTYKKIKAIRS